jgi:hypothetical protein
MWLWEEDPEYKKAQARMLGVLMVLLFVTGLSTAWIKQDWDAAMLVLVFGASFSLSAVVLPLTAWLLIKLVRAALRPSRARPVRPKEKPSE